MLCSKLHCQKGFKLKPFFYKIPSDLVQLGVASLQESFGGWLIVQTTGCRSASERKGNT